MKCKGHTDWVKRRQEMQGSCRLGKEKTRNARVMPIGYRKDMKCKGHADWAKRRHEMQGSCRLGKEKT